MFYLFLYFACSDKQTVYVFCAARLSFLFIFRFMQIEARQVDKKYNSCVCDTHNKERKRFRIEF